MYINSYLYRGALTFVVALWVLTLCVFLVSACSESQSSSDLIQPAIKEVTFTTGASGKEIEWKITEVKRTNNYTQLTPTVGVVQADTVELKGEARPSDFVQSAGLFDEKYPFTYFSLLDLSGREFQPHFETAMGRQERGADAKHFKVSFIISVEVKENINVKNWGDLFVSDPDPANVTIPGHKVSLAVFNEE